MIGNPSSGATVPIGRSGWASSDNCARVTRDRRRNIEPFDSVKQSIQLVAIQIADELGRIEQRSRPARRGLVDLAQGVAALFGVRRNHDGDVMFGQWFRQIDAGDDVKRLQLDRGVLQQELDRRVAAHVDRGRKRKDAQLRLLHRTGRTKQLMEGNHFRLDRQSRLLVAQQLRDQREIEPLAGPGRAARDLRDQFIPQRTQIGAAKRHRREPGKSDSIRAGIMHEIGAGGPQPARPKSPCRLRPGKCETNRSIFATRRRRGQFRAAGSDAPLPRRMTRSR